MSRSIHHLAHTEELVNRREKRRMSCKLTESGPENKDNKNRRLGSTLQETTPLNQSFAPFRIHQYMLHPYLSSNPSALYPPHPVRASSFIFVFRLLTIDLISYHLNFLFVATAFQSRLSSGNHRQQVGPHEEITGDRDSCDWTYRRLGRRGL